MNSVSQLSTRSQRKLGLRTVIFASLGLTVGGILLTNRLNRPAPLAAHLRPFSIQINAQDVSEWLLTMEGLVVQRTEGTLVCRSKTLTGFLAELRERRAEWEGRLDFTGMRYDRLLRLTAAIRYARSAIYLDELQRQEMMRVARSIEALRPGDASASDPGLPQPPSYRAPRFEPGAQAASIEVYRAHREPIERVLQALELGVR